MNECLTHAISWCFSESSESRCGREEAGGQKEKGSVIVGEVCDSVTDNIQFINL